MKYYVCDKCGSVWAWESFSGACRDCGSYAIFRYDKARPAWEHSAVVQERRKLRVVK